MNLNKEVKNLIAQIERHLNDLNDVVGLNKIDTLGFSKAKDLLKIDYDDSTLVNKYSSFIGCSAYLG